MRKVVGVSREFPEPLMAGLAQHAHIRMLDGARDSTALEGLAAWVGTVVDRVDAELIDRFPDSLGLIANYGVGTDNIDLVAARQRGIAVSNTPVVAEDTADLTMALMLAACRRLSRCESLVRSGDFLAGAKTLGQRVHGKTLGIVGFGDIGQAVARRARGFDMQVLYTGPHRKQEPEQDIGAEFCADLQQLLNRADIVSLHCPLTEQTRHLLNAQTLGYLKAGAVLVNTGRGPLIHEDALIALLESGHLGGVGLDVFEFEPEIAPALLGFDNVTLLPHIGSASSECRADMAMSVVANVASFLSAGVPLNPVVDRSR